MSMKTLRRWRMLTVTWKQLPWQALFFHCQLAQRKSKHNKEELSPRRAHDKVKKKQSLQILPLAGLLRPVNKYFCVETPLFGHCRGNWCWRRRWYSSLHNQRIRKDKKNYANQSHHINKALKSTNITFSQENQ